MFSMILNLQTLFHIYRFCYLNLMLQIKLLAVMKCSTVYIHKFVLLLVTARRVSSPAPNKLSHSYTAV